MFLYAQCITFIKLFSKTKDERLWVSTNAQSNVIIWRKISGINVTNFIRYITVDPNNPLHVIVTGTSNGTIKWYSDKEGLNEIGERNTYSADIDQTTVFMCKKYLIVLSNTASCFSSSISKVTAMVLTPTDEPEVTDDIGRFLMTYNKYQEQLNLQNLETGNYRIKIIGERGIKVFKIVIE